MAMMSLFALLPEVARRETCDATIMPPEGGDESGGLPAGCYGFAESYCIDPHCDCRRVLITVFSKEQRRPLAVIGHAFEPPGPDSLVREQTYLDPILPQSEWAEELLDLFVNVILADAAYAKRLVRHYGLVKAAIHNPRDPIHERVNAAEGPRPQPRRGKHRRR